MAHLPPVTDADFDAEVLKAPAAVVDVWGEGWPACVRLAPVVEQIANDYAGKLKVVGLNAHENYDTAAAYGIMGIPTLLFFKGGQEVARLVGAHPKDRILAETKAKLGV